MKVELNAGLGFYRNSKPSGVTKAPQIQQAAKTDIAEFSHGAAPALEKSLSGAKVAIQRGVNATTDPARLEALKQSVREGSYHVSTDDLVKAILDA